MAVTERRKECKAVDMASDWHAPYGLPERIEQMGLAGVSVIERRPPISSRRFRTALDGAARGSFDRLRDAIASARLIKRTHPNSLVSVVDSQTGQTVIEID